MSIYKKTYADFKSFCIAVVRCERCAVAAADERKSLGITHPLSTYLLQLRKLSSFDLQI